MHHSTNETRPSPSVPPGAPIARTRYPRAAPDFRPGYVCVGSGVHGVCVWGSGGAHSDHARAAKRARSRLASWPSCRRTKAEGATPIVWLRRRLGSSHMPPGHCTFFFSCLSFLLRVLCLPAPFLPSPGTKERVRDFCPLAARRITE